jgi:hypothetical protein
MSKLASPSAQPASRRAKAFLLREAKAQKLVDSRFQSQIDKQLDQRWKFAGEKWVRKTIAGGDGDV